MRPVSRAVMVEGWEFGSASLRDLMDKFKCGSCIYGLEMYNWLFEPYMFWSKRSEVIYD